MSGLLGYVADGLAATLGRRAAPGVEVRAPQQRPHPPGGDQQPLPAERPTGRSRTVSVVASSCCPRVMTSVTGRCPYARHSSESAASTSATEPNGGSLRGLVRCVNRADRVAIALHLGRPQTQVSNRRISRCRGRRGAARRRRRGCSGRWSIARVFRWSCALQWSQIQVVAPRPFSARERPARRQPRT